MKRYLVLKVLDNVIMDDIVAVVDDKVKYMSCAKDWAKLREARGHVGRAENIGPK